MKSIHWILGLISKRSCYRSDGKPKQRYNTKQSASKAAINMSEKTGNKLDVYRCWFRCRKYHIGRSADDSKK